MKIKQVIVIRTDLNMRKGKMCVQAAHASLMAYSEACSRYYDNLDRVCNVDDVAIFESWNDPINEYRKIALEVENEQELLIIYAKAKDAGLIVSLVKDLGLTEFKEKTYTCLCIGPHSDDLIDPLTGTLKPL